MRNYLANVVPAVITTLFMSLYTTVDGLFAARLINTDALAAINISYPIMNLMFTLSLGLASGGSIWIARALGETRREEAGRRLTLTLVLGWMGSLAAILIIGLRFEAFLRFLGATDRLIGYCRLYGGILLLFYPVGITKEVLTYALRAQGSAGIAMVCSVSGGVLNIGLDYLFMAVYGWGVAGAAAATGLGMTAVLAMDAVLLIRGLKSGGIRLCALNRQWLKDARSILALSLPAGILEFSYAITIWLFNLLSLSFYQEDGVAAFTVISYIQYAFSAVLIGLGNGITPLMAYYCGAGFWKENWKTCKRTIRCAGAAGLLLCLLVIGQAGALAGMFVERDTRAYELSRRGIQLLAPSYLFMGINIITVSILNAMGGGALPAGLTLLRTVVFLAAGACVLTRFMGYDGISASYVLSETITWLFSAPILFRKSRWLRCTSRSP